MNHFRPIDVAAAEPFPTINTTPLIDLMLVLLVMFIISIPIATHKVPLHLPEGVPPPGDSAPVHQLDLDAAGQLFWDGRPIADSALTPLLVRMAADPAPPELHLAAHPQT